MHILLLELMNGGQFSPYDAFWLSRWIPHWYQVTSLAEATRPAPVRTAIISSSISTAPKD